MSAQVFKKCNEEIITNLTCSTNPDTFMFLAGTSNKNGVLLYSTPRRIINGSYMYVDQLDFDFPFTTVNIGSFIQDNIVNVVIYFSNQIASPGKLYYRLYTYTENSLDMVLSKNGVFDVITSDIVCCSGDGFMVFYIDSTEGLVVYGAYRPFDDNQFVRIWYDEPIEPFNIVLNNASNTHINGYYMVNFCYQNNDKSYTKGVNLIVLSSDFTKYFINDITNIEYMTLTNKKGTFILADSLNEVFYSYTVTNSPNSNIYLMNATYMEDTFMLSDYTTINTKIPNNFLYNISVNFSNYEQVIITSQSEYSKGFYYYVDKVFDPNAVNFQFVGTYTNYEFLDIGNSINYQQIYLLSDKGQGLFTNNAPTCFIKGTYIDTLYGHKKIESLKKGDIIKTHTGEYVPIHYIGYGFLLPHMYNDIYQMKKNTLSTNNPFKDLYLTGGHSLLFTNDTYKNTNYNPNEYENNINSFIKIKASQCSLFEQATNIHTLIEPDNNVLYYHIALESEDEHKQYGIYANNILTETMSIAYIPTSGLHELS